MKELKFPKMLTFIYGVCTDDKLMDVVSAAEEHGCQFLQVVPGMVMPQKSVLDVSNTAPRPIAVLKVIVRATEDVYKMLVKEAQKEMGVN